MRVHLQTLGCRLNEAELETWSRQFREQGFELAPDAASADLLVVNTCAVTREAVRKSRNLVRRAGGGNPAARIVMTGCYATLDPERAAADLGVDLLVPNASKDRLVDLVRAELAVDNTPALAREPDAGLLLREGRQRAFIKVQDGCRYRCTYCIVTLARGGERSRAVDDIVAEIERHAGQGIGEIVLTGVHLGGYGAGSGSTLRDLVAAVLDRTRIGRVRLGSLEPWDLPPDFWSLFDDPRMMPHLHLPIQSGADSVLRRMARRCRTDEFRDLVTAGRARVANLNVTTDIIVGFPGETAEEWQQTLAFARAMQFGHIHVFAYSAREGTKAAGLPGQLDRQTKRARSRELHAVAAASRARTLRDRVGRVTEVLFENATPEAEDGARWSGYSPDYLRVQVPCAAGIDLENRVATVRLTGVNDAGDTLLGRLEDGPR